MEASLAPLPDELSFAWKGLDVTDGNGDIWTTLGAGGLGAAIGVIGTIATALINRQPPMAAMIDARIRTLIEGYESRIGDLQREIAKLERKIDALTKALEETG